MAVPGAQGGGPNASPAVTIGGVTEADGANVTLGAKADAKVGDATGTVNAHLRYIAAEMLALVTALTNPLPVAASSETSIIYEGTTALTPKFAPIALSATGTIVALVAAKKIRVLALYLSSSGTVNVKFQSHVTPTDLTGLAYEVANTGFTLPFCPVGWFQTIAGEALDLNLSAGVAVGGALVYVEA